MSSGDVPSSQDHATSGGITPRTLRSSGGVQPTDGFSPRDASEGGIPASTGDHEDPGVSVSQRDYQEGSGAGAGAGAGAGYYGAGGDEVVGRVMAVRPERPVSKFRSSLNDVAMDAVEEEMMVNFASFISNFHNRDADGNEAEEAFYEVSLAETLESGHTTLHVSFEDVLQHSEPMAGLLLDEYYKYDLALRRAVQRVVKNLWPQHATDVHGRDKEFYVSFYKMKMVHKVRELRSKEVGRLVAISGTVTRTSEVRPELLYGTFKCGECGGYVRNVAQQFKYTEPMRCPTEACKNPGKWELLTDESIFVDWQRLRVQENADEIPAGSMPRTVDVICRHSSVERAKAGDKVTVVGTVIAVPDVGTLLKTRHSTHVSRRATNSNMTEGGVSGLKALGVRELTYKLSFLASSVEPKSARGIADDDEMDDDDDGAGENKRLLALLRNMSEEARAKVHEMSASANIFSDLAKSIAPSITKNETIKKGVLLMLLGGVQKETSDGIRLRGDLNVCVVGDPSTAKSQFLKWTTGFLPHAVYTSGKASSSAGLTAAVVKDPDTGEYCIEAGALMLADNSVCCIDEFDKMDIGDQVAIHEAMEQQTISITKAGIQATLNARTSILAAANPIFGRYDRSRTLRQNVNISAPIMSRFDLFFVVLDEANPQIDHTIATHILDVHMRNRRHIKVPYTVDDLRNYINVARCFDPVLTESAQRAIVQYYVRLRAADSSGASAQSYRITVRQLESCVRLAEAVARAHMAMEVTAAHVKIAFMLLRTSILTVDTPDVALMDIDMPQDVGDGASTTADGSDAASVRSGAGASPTKSTSGSSTASPAKSTSSAATSSSGGSTGGDTRPRRGLSLSYQRYKFMAQSIAEYVRLAESKALAETRDEDESTWLGMTQKEVVDWFLGTHVLPGLDDDLAEASLEAVMAEERMIVNRVITRLVTHDHVLVRVDFEQSDKEVPEDERRIAVHPNWVP